MDLRLPLSPDDAARLARAELTRLGWSISSEDHLRLEARQDASRLPCHSQPVSAAILFEAEARKTTDMTILGRAPGWGPVASRNAREQTDLLTRRIGLACARAARNKRAQFLQEPA